MAKPCRVAPQATFFARTRARASEGIMTEIKSARIATTTKSSSRVKARDRFNRAFRINGLYAGNWLSVASRPPRGGVCARAPLAVFFCEYYCEPRRHEGEIMKYEL